MCSNVECLCWTCIWFCFAVDAIVVVISFQCSPIKYTIDNVSVYRYVWLWKLVYWGKNRSSTHLEFVNRYKGHLFSAPLRENDVLHICLMYNIYKYTVQGNSLHFANIKEKASLNAVAARLITYFLGSILMNDFSPWFAVLEDGMAFTSAWLVLLLLLLLSVTLCLGCGTISLCFVEPRFTGGETENIQDCLMAVLILLLRVSALPQSASCFHTSYPVGCLPSTLEYFLNSYSFVEGNKF